MYGFVCVGPINANIYIAFSLLQRKPFHQLIPTITALGTFPYQEAIEKCEQAKEQIKVWVKKYKSSGLPDQEW